MKKIFLFLIFGTALLFFACEKEISIDNLPQPTDKIVVEGHIEPGKFPYVILTRNAPYFAPVDSAVLANIVVQNAFVTISDGITERPSSGPWMPRIWKLLTAWFR